VTWPIFAVLQMLITTVAVGVTLWLRMRTVHKQNLAYQAQFASLEAHAGNPSTAEFLDNLDSEQATAPLLRLLLEHHDNPKDDIDEQLRTCAEPLGLSAGSDNEDDSVSAEEHQTVLNEIEELKEQLTSANNRGETDELRNLLMQFTNDSREMMACIATLEKENAKLRGDLGIEESDAPQESDTSADSTNNEIETDEATTPDDKTDDAPTPDVTQIDDPETQTPDVSAEAPPDAQDTAADSNAPSSSPVEPTTT